MSDENIVIQVQDKVPNTIADKLVQIGAAAVSAHNSVTMLQAALRGFTTGGALNTALGTATSSVKGLSVAVSQVTTNVNTLNNAAGTAGTVFGQLGNSAQSAVGNVAALGQTAVQTAQQLQAMGQAGQAGANGLGSITSSAGGVSQAVSGATTNVGGLNSAVGQFAVGATVFNVVKNAVMELGSEVASVLTKALDLTKTIASWEAEADRFRIGIMQVSANSEAAAANTAFLNKTINDLGLNMKPTIDGFIKFAAATKGTNLQGQETQQIFLALSQASSVLHMDMQQQALSFLALSQMASKGKISMEELQRQLADHLPGALQLAATAMQTNVAGLTEMISRGKLYADDFLPKFADAIKKNYGDAVGEASDSAQAGLNRFSTAWARLEMQIGQSGLGKAASNQLNILTDAMDRVSESMEIARKRGAGFWGQFAAGAGAVGEFLNPANAFGYQAQSTNGLKTQIAEWQGMLKTATGFYEKNQLIYKIQQAQADLSKREAALNAGAPPASSTDLTPAQKQQILDDNNKNRLSQYLNDGKFLSPAQTLAKQRQALSDEFAATVKDMQKGTAQYTEAWNAYQERLKNLEDKAARPGQRAAHKQQQNVLSEQIQALEGQKNVVKGVYDQQTADLQTALANQELTQSQYIIRMGDLKNTELEKLKTIALQEAELARGKDQLSARRKFLDEAASYDQQEVTNKSKVSAQLAALNRKTTLDAQNALNNFNTQGQQRNSSNDNQLAGITVSSQTLADLQQLQAIMKSAAQSRQQLTNTATRDGQLYSVAYIQGLNNINIAEQQQLAEEQAFFQQRDQMNSDWTNGITQGLSQISRLSANTAKETSDLWVQGFQSMSSQLATFVTTGKLNFGSLVQSMIEGFIRIQLQAAGSKILSAIFGAAGAFAGNASMFGGSQFSTGIGASGAGVNAGSIGGSGALFGPTAGIGFASGGYTGDMGVNVPAGVVHGQEFVLNANATAMPGVRAWAEALNAGQVSPPPSSSGASGGGVQYGAAGPAVQPKLSVIVNNTQSDKVDVQAKQSQDENGMPQIELLIGPIRSALAGEISGGRGELHDSIKGKFNLQSQPGKG